MTSKWPKKVLIDWGFSCGRHWISINGRMIAQTTGDECCIPDEAVKEIITKILERL